MDILVTHTPPFVEDWNVDVSLQTQSPHFGSRALAATLARVKPKLAFCGHIHTGDHRIHDMVHENGLITKIYNVSRLNEDYAVAYESQIEYACRSEDLVKLTFEIDEDLVLKARKMFHEYGISLEQGASMFIEEFVRAKGDMDKSAMATTERLQRVRNSCPQFANCGPEKGERQMERLCPKCATGACPWRDGIMCRNYVCARDNAGSREDILKGLPPGFAEIIGGFGKPPHERKAN